MQRNVQAHLLLCLLTGLLATQDLSARGDEVNYLDLAALMLRDGNLQRAVLALDQVDTSAGGLDLLRYHTLRGMAHLRLEEPGPAVASLELAVGTGRAESIVHVYLAQAYFELEEYRKVLDTLDHAQDLLSRITAVHHMRAQCYWLLGETAMALAALDLASRSFPDDYAFLRRKVFFLIELGLFQQAAIEGREYLRRSEGRLEDYMALGTAMRASGETDAAITLLEQARMRFPRNPEINKILARAYLDRNQVNTAAELINEAALLEPGLVSEAAELYRRAGRLHRALLLNSQISDQQVKLRQRLALLLELQHYNQAAAMVDDLQRIGLLDDEDIRYALAYAVFKSGDFEQSEQHLRVITRPDLFRRAAELRSAMQDCATESWQCL